MLLRHYVLPVLLALALYIFCVRKECKLDAGAMRDLAIAYRARTDAGRGQVDSRAPLLGIVSVVTGATSGIGKELAQELYRLGATVVVAGRTESKISDTMAEIKRVVNDSAGSLQSGLIDTSDLASVKRFASALGSRHRGGIDFLINNAGIHYASLAAPADEDRQRFFSSPQGYDLAFATNYLGHFLLTKLLLPLLKKRSHAKIINVSSTFHMQADGVMLMPPSGGGMPLAARDDIGTFSHRRRSYSNNKLAQVLHAKELQRRLDKEGGSPPEGRVKAFSMCPLWVSTNILGSSAGAYFVRLFAFTTNAVMVTPLTALLSTDLQGGEYVTAGGVWLAAQSWSGHIFKGSAAVGLRDVLCEAFAVYILVVQSLSYGFTVQRSSPESFDEQLARELFDWSDRAVSS